MSFISSRRFYRPARRGHPAPRWRPSSPRYGNHAGRVGSNLDYAKVKSIILSVFFLAAIIWFAYFFFASRHFAIAVVNINGLESIPRADMDNAVSAGLAERRWLFFRQSNILLLSKDRLAAKIAQKYIFELININRDFPYTLNITVKEKTARLILRSLRQIAVESADAAASSTPVALSAPEYFYLDVNGIVMAKPADLDEAGLAAYPVVEIIDSGQSPIKPGDVALGSEAVDFIFKLYDGLKNSSAGITVKYISYDPKVGDELKFATSELWQGIVTRKLDLEAQIKKLELALAERIKEQRRNLQYIDLRVKDRVYYK